MLPSRRPCPEAAVRHCGAIFQCRGDPNWQQIMKLGLGNPGQNRRPHFMMSICRKPVEQFRIIFPNLSKFYRFEAWPKIVGLEFANGLFFDLANAWGRLGGVGHPALPTGSCRRPIGSR